MVVYVAFQTDFIVCIAQITLNALLRNDQIAEAGAATIDQNGADQGENFLYIGPVERHKCQCCSSKSKAKESKKDEIGLSQQLMCSSNALSTWSFSSLPSLSSNSGVGHFCNEYMRCRNLRLKIKKKLQITGGDIKCSCDDWFMEQITIKRQWGNCKLVILVATCFYFIV